MVIIKNYKVKKYLTNFRKDWNKFPEIFCGKFSNSQPYVTGLHFNYVPENYERAISTLGKFSQCCRLTGRMAPRPWSVR